MSDLRTTASDLAALLAARGFHGAAGLATAALDRHPPPDAQLAVALGAALRDVAGALLRTPPLHRRRQVRLALLLDAVAWVQRWANGERDVERVTGEDVMPDCAASAVATAATPDYDAWWLSEEVEYQIRAARRLARGGEP